jgi:hypothetical protein
MRLSVVNTPLFVGFARARREQTGRPPYLIILNAYIRWFSLLTGCNEPVEYWNSGLPSESLSMDLCFLKPPSRLLPSNLEVSYWALSSKNHNEIRNITTKYLSSLDHRMDRPQDSGSGSDSLVRISPSVNQPLLSFFSIARGIYKLHRARQLCQRISTRIPRHRYHCIPWYYPIHASKTDPSHYHFRYMCPIQIYEYFPGLPEDLWSSL